ncbi:MAG: ATP-binding cassette domain-containing protein [Acidobacteriota bacterium]|nr:ATP-binding cassette domain-containing protein [Acidobacteriota bacterium]
MAEPGVQFEDVSYVLPGGRALIRGVSLTLAAGTTTALLGRSGSGKTTLLRMVNGLVAPSAGRVLNRGVDPAGLDGAGMTRLRRATGYVIQETGLFPHLSVERNAGMALELANTPVPARAGRVAESLRLAGLDAAELAERLPWQLSGGQRQRVGLARALAPDPGVLLLDEPFGALDPVTRAELQTTLRDLLAGLGKTALLVTHDLDEALYLAQRIVFLDGGAVVADLAAAEVRASSNAYIRGYIAAVHHAGGEA